MPERVKVGLVGLGTVGAGVAQLLIEHGDRTARHAGRELWLEEIVTRTPEKQRRVDLGQARISSDLARITENPEIKVVAQLVGGLEPARSIMLRLLESGKDVVTANKALLAEHGPELFDAARELGRSIAFEASVGGGIPIVANISQCLSANEVSSIQGILNGTSNFILSKMEEGSSFDAAVAEAQRLGFAEADPTMDVDGSDAAQKLAILAHLAFGARTHWSEIPRRGIADLDADDLRYAQELGYRIKLLAVARRVGAALELHVSPTLAPIGSPLAEVREAFNAVNVVGDAVGPVFFHGLGAGQMPTASAVVADMIDTAVGRTAITFRTLELWSGREEGVATGDRRDAISRYYLRFVVDDHPGVLAQIAGQLGQQEISIASVIQHQPRGAGDQRQVPLVIMTHAATEGAIEAALARIDRLEAVRRESVRMRVLA